MSPYNARLYTAITFAWPGLVARWVAEKKSLVVEVRYNCTDAVYRRPLQTLRASAREAPRYRDDGA